MINPELPSSPESVGRDRGGPGGLRTAPIEQTGRSRLLGIAARMIGMRTLLQWVVIGIVAQSVCPSAAADEVRFNEQIRPILAEHCLQCHGPDEKKREASLRLDIERDAKESAIVAYQPDESALIERITSDDPELKMPPAETGKPLSAEQIELLRRWIAAGARFDRHWAYESIETPEIPRAEAAAVTDIDRFVVAALEAQGLSLSRRIGRQQLIRRATFDLIGLPPTWEEVEAFASDSSRLAYAKVIDRLLDSPRYGERWGRHWLDIARYADTHGGGAIGFTKFPFSYTYRDYVIRALNADLPYNRFVIEQLAADQLNLANNDPALAGLGFLTVGVQYPNPHDVIDDQIDVVTRGLMGMTVACARCHDHKFDAIPTTDYYALYAALASSHKPDLLPIVGEPADPESLHSYQTDLAKRQVVYTDMARDQTEVLRGRLRMQVGLYLREIAKGTPEQDLSAKFLSFRTDDMRPHLLNRWRDYLAKMPSDDPVFGPWVQLAALPSEGFPQSCDRCLKAWQLENGDPEKFAAPHQLSTAAPKWNPRLLEAIAKQQSTSMQEVADLYGALFADVQREWLQSLLNASLEAAAGADVIPDEDRRHAVINSAINRQLRRHLYDPETPIAMSGALATKLLNRTVNDILGGKKGAIHNLHLSSPGSPPRAMVLQERITTDPFHVLRRGNPIDRGEVVPARFLTALSAPDAPPFPAGNRRLALAQAIVDSKNPLLRRVTVNWVWQHHFGRGLVRTPDDFGTRGQPPTHPQLLDYLAVKFLDEGWSLKKLHRQIMLSDTYQQAAVENADSRIKDPENKLLWRMPRRRLEMEAMRDAMLAASGELDVTKIGGRPFDFLSNPVVPRRSLYGLVNRDIISSLASTFDRADPSTCTARRPETSVPQQTLFALNSDFIQDRAAALAELATRAESDEQRVRWIYRRLFSREPDQAELQTALQYVGKRQETANGETADPDRWQRLAHVLLAANEFVFLD